MCPVTGCKILYLKASDELLPGKGRKSIRVGAQSGASLLPGYHSVSESEWFSGSHLCAVCLVRSEQTTPSRCPSSPAHRCTGPTVGQSVLRRRAHSAPGEPEPLVLVVTSSTGHLSVSAEP
jgi:hypothetical protein